MKNSLRNSYRKLGEKIFQRTIEKSIRTVWFDQDYDSITSKNDNLTFITLSKIDPDLVIFHDSNKCIDYIKNLNVEHYKIILIISTNIQSSSFSTFLLVFEKLSQIDEIYILCNTNEVSLQNFPELVKIRNTHSNLDSLCEDLKQLPCLQLKRRKKPSRRDLIIDSFSSVNIPFVTSVDDLDHLPFQSDSKKRQESEFMYGQILRDILVDMESTEQEMIDFCRKKCADSVADLRVIDEFEDYYNAANAIYWYTRDTFLYRILNKALREQDLDVLYSLRYFIKDLHLQLKARHISQQQSIIPSEITDTTILKVYRGQLIAENEFDKKIRKNCGGFFSVSSFFSTTLHRDQAMIYAGDGSRFRTTKEHSVLFEISINNRVNKFPYANITLDSAFQEDESEILFTMGAVFRIVSVIEESEAFWIVKLNLTGDEDEELNTLGTFMRKLIIRSIPILNLSRLLLALGKYKKAEQYHLLSLQDSAVTEDYYIHANVYNDLGAISYFTDQEQAKAIEYFHKALEIKLMHLPETDPSVNIIYTNLGVLYTHYRDYDKALSYLKKALSSEEQTVDPDFRKIAIIYSNIGVVYHEQKLYDESLLMLDKALSLQIENAPVNHPTLAALYTNIANVYCDQGNYDEANKYFSKTLEIQQNSLPTDHPNFGATYDSMAYVFYKQGKWKETWRYCMKKHHILNVNNQTNDYLPHQNLIDRQFNTPFLQSVRIFLLISSVVIYLLFLDKLSSIAIGTLLFLILILKK